VEKIATVLIAIIKTMLNTSNSIKTTIILKEKPSKINSQKNIKAVHAENLAARKNIVNATKLDCFVEIYVNV
jgi:hypothetical protein